MELWLPINSSIQGRGFRFSLESFSYIVCFFESVSLPLCLKMLYLPFKLFLYCLLVHMVVSIFFSLNWMIDYMYRV